jgi:uncharacterized repeat protein (TIGR03847 family)
VSDEFLISDPHVFSAGTEGVPGERIFLLFVSYEEGSLSVKVEKQQVAMMASYLAGIVRELGRPGELPVDLDFDTSLTPEWVVGTIGVSYEEQDDRLVVVLEEATDDGMGESVRVLLTKEQAAAFAIRATALVEAGRPPCPFCGLPLEPAPHLCPRTNGHRPPAT